MRISPVTNTKQTNKCSTIAAKSSVPETLTFPPQPLGKSAKGGSGSSPCLLGKRILSLLGCISVKICPQSETL